MQISPLLIMGSYIKVHYSNLTVWGMMIHRSRDVIDGERIDQDKYYYYFRYNTQNILLQRVMSCVGCFLLFDPNLKILINKMDIKTEFWWGVNLVKSWLTSFSFWFFLFILYPCRELFLIKHCNAAPINQSLKMIIHWFLLDFFLLVSIFCISSINAAELGILI